MWRPTSEREGQKIIVTYRDIPHNYIETTMMEIDRIRQMVREQGIDLQVQGLVCLTREIKKYTGSIVRHQNKGGEVYVALIKHKDFYLSKSFNTRAEAEDTIHLTNVREGLPIRNKSTIFEDRVLVDLSGNKLLICKVEELYLVEMHNWYCLSNGYAVTHTSSSTTLQCFHNMVMKHILTEITVDHINRNGLDNHQANLCLVESELNALIVLCSEIIPQALLESIVTNMVINGLLRGKMRKGTSIQNHILQKIWQQQCSCLSN